MNLTISIPDLLLSRKVLNSIPLKTKDFLQAFDEESQAYRLFSQSSHGNISFHKKKNQKSETTFIKIFEEIRFSLLFWGIETVETVKVNARVLKRLKSRLPSCTTHVKYDVFNGPWGLETMVTILWGCACRIRDFFAAKWCNLG